ncbi:MAG: OmpA family protein [Pseudomonadota bacterium]
MFSFAVVSLTLAMFMLFGFPPPKSTIILIPDADGKVGEVSVSNQTGTQTINVAYTAIEVKDSKSNLDPAKKIDQNQVLQLFDSALSSKPDKVTNYVLYFISGTSNLTEESTALIPSIVKDIKSRTIYEAYIVGHTDTTGSNETNYKLGLNRAVTTGNILNTYFPDNKYIHVVSYGEGSLIIPTADNVDEAKNRRVEIEIH